MSKQERVVCAAVKVIGFHVEPFDRFKTPIDYALSGVDHKSIRKDGSYKDLKFVEIESEQEGFLTNKNRFVDPIEARKIACESGQAQMIMLTSMPPKIKPLTPEDLY